MYYNLQYIQAAVYKLIETIIIITKHANENINKYVPVTKHKHMYYNVQPIFIFLTRHSLILQP